MEKNDFTESVFLPRGTVLCGGKYIIERKIGSGGFGITYQAVQMGLNRRVCIKEYFLNGSCVRNTRMRTVQCEPSSVAVYEKFRQAFVNEARMVASLRHPNIVEVIDIFDQYNTSYMVMPFIEGISLNERVKKYGALSYDEAVNYLAQIGDAVGYIHARNILHRDIKPDNIMLTAEYKAVLIDFGSAREFMNNKTQRHTVMLTKGFAPSEQYTENGRRGYYTDIYSLGATFYFALTGQIPVDSMARLVERLPEPREYVPDIPEDANRTIMKAMQLMPENRHQDMREFMDDLRSVRPSTLIDETVGEGRKNSFKKTLVTVLVCVGVFLLLGSGFVWWYLTKDKVRTVDFTGGLYPMIEVEGGSFVMGNDRLNQKGYDDCPPHEVFVSDFYIGQFEVSQGFWREIMGENPASYKPKKDYKGSFLSYEQRDSFPVESVSFYEVQEFIERLNSRYPSVTFSLPTEAEWEYAARGGVKAQPNERFANGRLSPAGIWYKTKAPYNHPIRVKYIESVNGLGIYQMSGNVAEWCLDYYDESFYEENGRDINPCNKNPNEEGLRVWRGGSFSSGDEDYINVSYRGCWQEDKGANDIGFRLVAKKNRQLYK